MMLYLTTPIFYVNAQPHLGHAYTAVVADAVVRFARLDGNEVFFQTGTDEHGDKIVQAAREAGVEVREYTDRISALFRQAWPILEVEPDNFIRTTDPEHIRVVQGILQQVHDQGDIYFSDYTGHYCRGCERFLTDKELSDGKCPDHQVPPEEIREQNYFFRMSRYQQWLIEHIKEHPEFITPERYRNEVLSFLSEPLDDLCISRPLSRLEWGIPLPFDENFVTYVWFDALINYISGIGYPDAADFAPRWAAAEHLIAKDILKPHAIFWPTMLRAMGLPPYRRLHVHGYWNVNEAKMSKSIGNVVRPQGMVEQFGADTVRYFLLREMSFGLDASYSDEAVLARRNSDLANDLGNLFSRSLTMVKNFADSRVPTPGPLNAEDQELADACLAMLESYGQHMRQFAFRQALEVVWEVIGRANRYIVTNAPWELAKEPGREERLATVLNTLLETLRCIATTLGPVMPGAAAKMAAALPLEAGLTLAGQRRWGVLPVGGAVTVGDNLFPRLKKG
ncbi:MAG: methionine--tRNA ligase [Desulfurivibrio sp.]|nr:methionine--tRNA ligase [Desulfurivibrio sp.]